MNGKISLLVMVNGFHQPSIDMWCKQTFNFIFTKLNQFKEKDLFLRFIFKYLCPHLWISGLS